MAEPRPEGRVAERATGARRLGAPNFDESAEGAIDRWKRAQVMKLTLLSRAYCHLCDEMLADLRPIAQAHGANVEVIDVDAPAHAALEAAWGDRVPALFAGTPDGGVLVCQYRLDPVRVRAVLGAADGNPL